MSGEREDGGPAFPAPAQPLTNMRLEDVTSGMFLRDYFAAQALAMTVSTYVNLPDTARLLAERCYAVADAMLAARAKP